MNEPPKLRLWAPRSQLSVLSMFQLVVFRSSSPVRFPGDVRPNMLAAVKLQPKPPCWSNMSEVTLVENSSGDHCHPPRSSLTRFEDSVERRLVEPTVRYEGDAEVREARERRVVVVEDVGLGHQAGPSEYVPLSRWFDDRLMSTRPVGACCLLVPAL